MPSGAKKRKAKRKKEHEHEHEHEHGIHHHPDSTSDAPPPPPLPLQGNGNHDDESGESGDNGSPSSRDEHHLTEEESEDKKVESMEGSEGRGVEDPLPPAQKLEETKDEVIAVEVEEIPPPPPPPLPPSTVPEDVSVEFVRSEREGESYEDEGPTDEALGGSGEERVIPIEQIVTVTEEVDQASEAVADDSVGVDAPSGQNEVNALPLSDRNTEPPSDTVRDPEPSPDTVKDDIAHQTEVAHAPLAERRSSLFSCCGLFDAFMGSQR